MGERFSFYQRQQLKQLVIECDVQRLTVEESLAYIKDRTNITISERYLYNLRKYVSQSIGPRLQHLREHRTAFIEQCFKRIDEIEKYQQELWTEYHKHPHNSYFHLNCIKELHQLTITLDNLYKDIPQYTGMTEIAQEILPEYNQELIRKQAVF